MIVTATRFEKRMTVTAVRYEERMTVTAMRYGKSDCHRNEV